MPASAAGNKVFRRRFGPATATASPRVRANAENSVTKAFNQRFQIERDQSARRSALLKSSACPILDRRPIRGAQLKIVDTV
jgi:hypothetical protein